MAIRLLLVTTCVIVVPNLQAKRPGAWPKFVDVRLLGMDLLHDGVESARARFGEPGETSSAAAGTIWRYRDPVQGIVFEILFDQESGAVRFARLLAAKQPVSTVSGRFKPAKPHTGRGVSLGDSPQAAERLLGPPAQKQPVSKQQTDFVYDLAESKDGGTPRYRGRYSFTGGKLSTIVVRIGE